jgi:hypothetical protein
LAGQLSRQQRRSIGYFLLIANWDFLDFDRARAALGSGYLDQSLRRLSSFHMQIGIRLVHLLTPFRSFNQSTNEPARFGQLAQKNFERCEKVRSEELSRVRNQKPSVSTVLAGLVGLSWAKMRWVFSGDVSDEAKRNIRTIGDRVGEVGSRDSGKPRAQPYKR